MQEGVPGKVVGDEEGKGGREEKEQEEGKKVEDEQGREEKKEGGEAKDGDKKRAEGQEEGTQTSDGRETVAGLWARAYFMMMSQIQYMHIRHVSNAIFAYRKWCKSSNNGPVWPPTPSPSWTTTPNVQTTTSCLQVYVSP